MILLPMFSLIYAIFTLQNLHLKLGESHHYNTLAPSIINALILGDRSVGSRPAGPHHSDLQGPSIPWQKLVQTLDAKQVLCLMADAVQ